MNKWSKAEQEKAEKMLRKDLQVRKVIWTQVVSRSKSGMSRTINFYHIKSNEPSRISFYIAAYLGLNYDNDSGGIVLKGAGYNAGREVIDRLSLKLYGDTRKISQRDMP